MKNKKIILSFSLILFSIPVFAGISKTQKKFIKASLTEKISIINNLSEDEKIGVSLKALDFSIENAAILQNDGDLTNLALASVLAFPSDSEQINKIKPSEQRQISEKFMTVFKLFKNLELRSEILKKLEWYSGTDKTLTVTFLNDYLTQAFQSNEKEDNVLEEAIVSLGKIGDNESLSIIYNIWVSKIWEKFHDSTDTALVSLSQDSFEDAIRIFSGSNIEDSAHYFSLLKKSDKISENSLCQIAENALLIAINNAENLSAKNETSGKAFVRFQLETHEVLTGHKWSHASSVINGNVVLAKQHYEKGIMDQKSFVTIVETSSKIPSPQLAQSLTDMLSECNGKVEKVSSDAENEMPARSVVLALIKALGEMGDKTAFDTLLAVTYLPYPLDVIDEAKKSLASLNW